MWNDNANKAHFQKLLRLATRILVRMRITPNQITVTTIALPLVAGGIVTTLPDQKWLLK